MLLCEDASLPIACIEHPRGMAIAIILAVMLPQAFRATTRR
jgi:hypothetical protein